MKENNFLFAIAIGAALIVLTVFATDVIGHRMASREWSRTYEINEDPHLRELERDYLMKAIYTPGYSKTYSYQEVYDAREALYNAREEYARSKGWRHPEKYRNH